MGVVNCALCQKNPYPNEKTANTLSYSPYEKKIFPLLKEKNAMSTANIPSSSSINSIKISEVTLEDFEILKNLGSGASGEIYLVRKKSSQKMYALKVIKKQEVSKRNQQEYAWNELIILQKHECPYIVSLRYSFQDEHHLFLVMDFLQGGDLFFHLRKEKRFTEETAAFYAAEILCALDYLHENHFLYRDLKPENILFDNKGHIKLIDFGLSKRLSIEKGVYKCNTLIGTPEYVAPEILLGNKYDKSADLWDVGCVLYEMLIGKPTFYSSNVKEIFRRIVEDEITFDEIGYPSPAAKEVLFGLLEKNPKKRTDSENLKKYQFFKNIDWDKMRKGLVEPPFKPLIEQEIDLKYFESRFVDKDLGGTIVGPDREESQFLYDYYMNFSYKKQMESL